MSSQHACGVIYNSVPGSPTPSSDFHEHQLNVHKHTCRQQTHESGLKVGAGKSVQARLAESDSQRVPSDLYMLRSMRIHVPVHVYAHELKTRTDSMFFLLTKMPKYKKRAKKIPAQKISSDPTEFLSGAA